MVMQRKETFKFCCDCKNYFLTSKRLCDGQTKDPWKLIYDLAVANNIKIIDFSQWNGFKGSSKDIQIIHSNAWSYEPFQSYRTWDKDAELEAEACTRNERE